MCIPLFERWPAAVGGGTSGFMPRRQDPQPSPPRRHTAEGSLRLCAKLFRWSNMHPTVRTLARRCGEQSAGFHAKTPRSTAKPAKKANGGGFFESLREKYQME